MCQGGKPDTGKFHSFFVGIYIIMNVCGSAYENGCVVDDMHNYYVCYGSGLSINQSSV